jgi:MoaA/NifB/PqqE/SkfB family radical SAM enzyme
MTLLQSEYRPRPGRPGSLDQRREDAARPAGSGGRRAALAALGHRLVDGAAAALHGLVQRVPGVMPLALFKRIPGIIVIDVTNLCNLRCPVCPVTVAMNRTRGMMSLQTFKMIVDDLARHRAKPAIYFNFSGEPTLNPELPELVAYAARHGHETFISTNATKLDRGLAERLIEAGLSRINLCLDGFTAEAQESYRIRSNFEQVKANIEGFAEARRRLGKPQPELVLQTLLTSKSETQADDMVAWAARIGLDQVRFKTFSLGSYTDAETRARFAHFLPTRAAWRRTQSGRVRRFCSFPFHQSVVFWNGDLGLCCIDYDQMVQLPNIEQGGFVGALRSDAVARARRNGFLKRFEVCRSCTYSNAENMGFRVRLRPRDAAAGGGQPG